MTTLQRLKPLERDFVERVVANFGCAAKALRETKRGKRLTPSSSRVVAFRLMRRPHVAAAIKERAEAVAHERGVNTGRVLEELCRIAYFDIGRIFDESGHLRAIHEIEEEVRSGIVSVEVEQRPGEKDEEGGYVTKIKVADKLKALNLLMQYLKMIQPQQLPPPVTPLTLDPTETARRIAFVLQAALYVDEAPPVLSGAVAPPEPLALHQQQQPAGENP